MSRIPWKIYAALLAAVLAFAAWRWTPGMDVRDGRNDRGRNGIVLDTSWIADDAWFARQKREGDKRDPLAASELARALREHRITEIYLRVPPPDADGALGGLDAARIEALLYECHDARGWAQIGAGDLPFGDVRWRRFFVLNARRLLDRHPRLRGLQLDLTAIADGDANFLALLDELRAALAPGARPLSITAGAWQEAYFREVAKRAEQLVVPMEAGMFSQSRNTVRVVNGLAWCENKPVLLRISADARLRKSLSAVHQSLSGTSVPANYQGLALDAGSAPDAGMWRVFRERFLKP